MSSQVRVNKDFENLKREYDSRTDNSCCFDILEDNWADALKFGGSLNNKKNFNLIIRGPPDSPYENGLFEINIKLEDGYPFVPPKISHVSEIYHPNINGPSICLSTLKDHWSPALTLYKVFMSIQALLGNPNPDDPLDPHCASELKHNKESFIKKARNATKNATEKIMEKRKLLQSKIVE